MFYTIYKITNVVNSKHYIGMHKTKNIDDGYMGSGKLIRRAIMKYGIENFTKEILHTFDNEVDMINKEKELVILSEMSYNLCDGGKGGFGHINRTRDHHQHNLRIAEKRSYKEEKLLAWYKSEKYKLMVSQNMAKAHKNGNMRHDGMLGKKHSAETKRQMSESGAGSNNSQYGSCWITNGVDNKKVKKEEAGSWERLGYRRGRC